MSDKDNLRRYLPLSESTTYILLALAEPRHGYAVMQWVTRASRGMVEVGPGTLYGAFQTLEKEGLIVKIHEADRRKTYALTPKGEAVLSEQLNRLETLGSAAASWRAASAASRGSRRKT